MIRRGAIAGLAAALVLIVLTGCAPERDPTWTPAAWPVYGQVVTSAPSGTVPGQVSTVDHRLRNDGVGIEARWAYLPGIQPFNDTVVQLVRGAIDAQAMTAGIPYRPQAYAAGAGLGDRGCVPGSTTAPAGEMLGPSTPVHTVVACEIAHAAGDIFAERLRVVRGSTSAVESDATTVVYTDVRTGEVATAQQLFGDPARLWTDLVEVLRREAGSLSIRPPDPPTAEDVATLAPALTSASFDGSSIVLQLPVGFIPPALENLSNLPTSTLDKPLFVALDTAAIADALTPLGQRVAAAAGPFTLAASAGAAWDRTDCDLVPCVALTLDDGPSELTPGILDVLRDQHAAATFYMLGQEARRYPDTVRRVAAEGHQVGNHTWNHPYLTTLDDEQIRSQLGPTAELLRALSGQPVTTWRPPGGFIDARVMAAAGQTAVLWSVDTRDWAGLADAPLRRYTIDAPNPGSIVLMHDIQPVTARVFSDVVTGLRDRGFSLVTIDALFGGRPPLGIVRYAP